MVKIKVLSISVLSLVLVAGHRQLPEEPAPSVRNQEDRVLQLLNQAKQVWFQEIHSRNGLERYVRAFAICGYPDQTIELIEEAHRPADTRRQMEIARSINFLIKHYCQQGQPEKVELLRSRLQDTCKEFSWFDSQVHAMLPAPTENPAPAGGDMKRDDAIKAVDVFIRQNIDAERKRRGSDTQKLRWLEDHVKMIAREMASRRHPQTAVSLLADIGVEHDPSNETQILDIAQRVGDHEWCIEYLKERGRPIQQQLRSMVLRARSDTKLHRRVVDELLADDVTRHDLHCLIAVAQYTDDVNLVQQIREALGDYDDWPDNGFLPVLAQLYARLGQLDESIKLLNSCNDTTILSPDEQNNPYHFDPMSGVAYWFVDAVMDERGEDQTMAALETINQISLPNFRALAKFELSRRLLEQGDVSAAGSPAADVREHLESLDGQLAGLKPQQVYPVFAKCGWEQEARQQLDMSKLSNCMMVCRHLLEAGKLTQCVALFRDVRENDLQSRSYQRSDETFDVFRQIARVDMQAVVRVFCGDLTRPEPMGGIQLGKGHYPSVFWDYLLEQNEIELAWEFWDVVVNELDDKDRSKFLSYVSRQFLAQRNPHRYGAETWERVRSALEKSVQNDRTLLIEYAVSGSTADITRHVNQIDKVQSKIQAFGFLVEAGMWDLIADRAEWDQDPRFSEIKVFSEAHNELLRGNLDRAIELCDQIDSELKRGEMLLKCAEEAHSPYLIQLRQIDNWLSSLAYREKNGMVRYPVSTDDLRKCEINVYHGMCGVADFYHRLYQRTGDSVHWIRMLQIHRTLSHDLAAAKATDDPGLFTGHSGVGLGLLRRSHKFSRVIQSQYVEQLAESFKNPDYVPATDIVSGRAGIGLYLLNDKQSTSVKTSMKLAIELGDSLIADAKSHALPSGENGLSWMMTPDFPREMPNYSHGTAGVCHFLIELHLAIEQRKNEPSWRGMSRELYAYNGRFRETAMAGAQYLLSLDAKHGDKGLLPHHFPDGESLFYLSWCHGPPGTCQLMNALARADKEGPWRAFSLAATDALLSEALHKNRTEGFWENVGICCGSTGVGSFLVDQATLFDEPRYLQEANRIAADILNRGTSGQTEDGRPTLCWVSAEHRVRPDFVQSQTGLMQGAAGVGLFLLQLEAVHGGATPFSILGDIME